MRKLLTSIRPAPAASMLAQFALFVALLIATGSAIAAPAHVQGGFNLGSFDGTNTTFTVTLAATVGSGNTAVGCWSAYNISTYPVTPVTQITDDKSNVYNLETAQGDGSTVYGYCFSLSNITNAPKIFTLVIPGSGGAGVMIVNEFSGTGTSGSDQRDSTAHGGQYQASPGTGASAVTSGNFTTATNGDLLYSYTVNLTNNTSTSTPTTTTNATYSGTGINSGSHPFANPQAISAWAVQSTAGASTAARWTETNNDAAITFLIAIKAAGGGAAVIPGALMPGPVIGVH